MKRQLLATYKSVDRLAIVEAHLTVENTQIIDSVCWNLIHCAHIRHNKLYLMACTVCLALTERSEDTGLRNTMKFPNINDLKELHEAKGKANLLVICFCGWHDCPVASLAGYLSPRVPI